MLLEIAIAYIIGIIGGLYKNIFFIVPFFVVFAYFLFKFKIIKLDKKVLLKKIVILIFVFTIGFINILNLENSFKNIYEDEQEVELVATIISNKKEKSNSIEYEIKAENGKYAKTKLILYIKKSKDINFEYGDKICIKGIYKEPEKARNYGSFSYKEYLKTKGIYGSINVSKLDIKLIKKNNVNIINRFANYLSTKIVQNVERNIEEKQAGLLIGILLGNKDYLKEEIEQNFKDSNLSHMLAVSGAHVSYIILGITYFFNKAKFNKRISKIITIILLLFFIVLVGGTPSVTRACLMAVYLIIGTLIYKKADIKSSICLSLLIIIIKNPYSLFDIGLQLSYGGTIGIILFSGKILKIANIKNENCNQKNKEKEKKNKNKLKDIIIKIISYIKQMAIISICANAIIMPIMAYHFSTISITFIISNILAGPILGIIVILGFIYCIFSIVFSPISLILSFILKIFLNILIEITNICSKLPFSKIYVKTPSLLLICAYYSCIFINLKFEFKNIICKLKKIGYKKIISIILIVLLIFQIIKIIPKDLKINFIDVGQGDSTLIVTPKNKTILIDGGGSSNSNYDVGKKTLLPYLLDRGITKIDYIIISHFDTDHATGVAQILGKIDVSSIILTRQLEENDTYRHILSIAKEKKIKLIYVKEGDVLKIGGVKISIIHPENKLMINNPMNNNSIVCKVEYNSFSMLLTGDIEMEAEELILRKNINLKADVLKVAHHGSKTSTTEEFLKAVNPKVALIGVGKNNNFGHPSNEVVQRLKENGTRIYRTDENGEISITVNKKGRIIKIQKCIT